MIQILNYDKIRCDKITRDEIFAQAEEQTNVADVVSEIIKTVREEATAHFLPTAKSSIKPF